MKGLHTHQHLSNILAWIVEEYTQHSNHTQDNGIVQIAHNIEGRDRGQASCHEELRTVRNESLSEATEGIEQRSTHATVYAITICNVTRHGTNGNESDSIISSAEVGKDDK